MTYEATHDILYHVDYPKFDIDVVVPLAKHPHARHMLACMVRFGFGNPGEWGAAFINACPSGSAPAELACDKQTPYSGHLLRRGWLSQDVLTEIAPTLCELRNPEKSINGLKLEDLASPLLPTKVVNSLAKQYRDVEPVMAILSANPNWKPSYEVLSKMTTQNQGAHIAALAKYGDLSSPKVTRILLNEIVHSENSLIEADIHPHVVQSLCERVDLPKELITSLDESAPPRAYEELIKSPKHRELVRSGEVSPHNYHKNHEGTLHVSSEATAKQLEALLEKGESLGDEMMIGEISRTSVVAQVAGHPNSTATWRKRAIAQKSCSEYAALIVLSEEPWAADEVSKLYKGRQTTMYGVSRMKSASPELLMEAAINASEKSQAIQDSCLLNLVSHQNFPWGEVGASHPLRKSTSKHQVAINCCEALASPSAEGHKEDPVAALFAQSLSGRQVEKLAELHPELTSLAALHPNGQGVPLESIQDKTTRATVSLLRAQTAELPGRSGATQKANAHILEM